MEVTVSSSGNLLNVRCTEAIRDLSPEEVAATVQQCVRAARDGIARLVEEKPRAMPTRE